MKARDALNFGLLTAFLLVFLTGCHDPRPLMTMPADGADLPILRQFNGPDSGETQRMQVVARRSDDWARMTLTDAPIDFESEMALAITLGRTTSEQQSVRITRIWRHNRQLRVEIATSPPPPGSVLTEATPFCVAIVPRCELEVAGFLSEPLPVKPGKRGEPHRAPVVRGQGGKGEAAPNVRK